MKSIGCLVNTFLRPSEGFIYEQVRSTRDFSVEVLTRDRANSGLFPYDKVNAMPSAERIPYTLTRRSRYFESVAVGKRLELIHAHFGVEGVYALPLARKLKLPLVVTFHGQDITRLPKFTVYPPAWTNYWLYYRALQREGALFLAVSEYIRRKLIEKGFPEEKVRTHYLGIDTGFQVQKGKRERMILTAGRLVEKKGTEYLVRSMPEVLRRYPDATLVIVGSGPLLGKLKGLADKLRIAENVVFTGWQSKDRVFELMSRASVFALPSVTAADGDAEGLGMVFLEAMLHELPLVGTDHGGIPDVVKDGKNGFLVPERDSSALSKSIVALLDDPALGENMGKTGKLLTEASFDIRRQIGRLEDMYRELV